MGIGKEMEQEDRRMGIGKRMQKLASGKRGEKGDVDRRESWRKHSRKIRMAAAYGCEKTGLRTCSIACIQAPHTHPQ
jgi:hypothetical protein